MGEIAAFLNALQPCSRFCAFLLRGVHDFDCPNNNVRRTQPYPAPDVKEGATGSVSNDSCPKCGYLRDSPNHQEGCDWGSGLKDSGKRLTYVSGMVRDVDDNKPRFELLFPLQVPFNEQMVTRVAEHLRKGAKKYAARNWEKGNSSEEMERAMASALRHLLQWMTGESDEDHAAAVITNVIFAETMRYKSAQRGSTTA